MFIESYTRHHSTPRNGHSDPRLPFVEYLLELKAGLRSTSPQKKLILLPKTRAAARCSEFPRDRQISNNRIISRFLQERRKRVVVAGCERMNFDSHDQGLVAKQLEKQLADMRKRENEESLMESRLLQPISTLGSSKVLFEPIPPRTVLPQKDRLTSAQSTPLLPSRKSALSSRKVFRKTNPSPQLLHRARLFMQLSLVVGLTFNIVVQSSLPQYRASVKRGNNGSLVRMLLRNRPWWSVGAQDEVAVNLVWTEWACPQTLQLSCCSAQSLQPSASAVVRIDPSRLAMPSFRSTQIQERKIFQRRKSQLQRLLLGHEQKWLYRQIEYAKGVDFFFKNENPYEGRMHPQRRTIGPSSMTHNHLQGHQQLHCKRLMYSNLRTLFKDQQHLLSIVPQTFIVRSDSQLQGLSSKLSPGQVWILKPGQHSNRGNGIKVCNSWSQIRQYVQSRSRSGGQSTILQRYITDCYLIDKRKFDIRCYVLVTQVGSRLRAYWYRQGYVRTSSRQFTLRNLKSRLIHLTNDAVQKKSADYGKFQNSNKMSFSELERYLTADGYSSQTLPDLCLKMKEIARLLVESAKGKLGGRPKHSGFQLFGLDFMLQMGKSSQDGRPPPLYPLLIQCNSNPCLSTSGTLLSRLIPQMLENVLRVAVDPFFPPPQSFLKKGIFKWVDGLQKNHFEVLL